jgi:hypothetical protein
MKTSVVVTTGFGNGGVSNNPLSMTKYKQQDLQCVVADARLCCLLCDSWIHNFFAEK